MLQNFFPFLTTFHQVFSSGSLTLGLFEKGLNISTFVKSKFSSCKGKNLKKANHNWRGHQTSPTVVSLKCRLPQKLQSKSTLFCEMVYIHSLFRHGFLKKPKSQFNQNRKQTYFVLK